MKIQYILLIKNLYNIDNSYEEKTFSIFKFK